MEERKKTADMTKECIVTALLMLMEEKPYESISITDIAERAGVSRMAYYRHYSGKDEILLDYIMSAAGNVDSELSSRDYITVYDVVLKTAYFLRENLPLLIAVSKTGQIDRVFDEVVRRIKEGFPVIQADKNTEYIMDFYLGGAVAVFKEWCIGGMTEEPEEISRKITELIGEEAGKRFKDLRVKK